MHLCYIDESGTPELPGTSTHFILAGLSIPIDKWKSCEREITVIKNKFCLQDAEIHTAWLLRNYIEQSKIHNFDHLDHASRIYEVKKYRAIELLRLQKTKNAKLLKQTKKNYKFTEKYIHLTRHV